MRQIFRDFNKGIPLIWKLRYIRIGSFTTSGDPPSGSSFKVIIGHLKRLIYERFARTDVHFEKTLIFKGAVREMLGTSNI